MLNVTACEFATLNARSAANYTKSSSFHPLWHPGDKGEAATYYKL